MSKRFIAVIISIALLLALAGCGSSQPAEPERVETPSGTFEVYRNSEYGISVQFPADWTKQDDVEGAIIKFFAPLQDAADTFSENLNIIEEDLGQRMTLDEYSQLSLEQLRKLGDIEISLSDATLSGLPAQEAFFTMNLQGMSMDFRQIWTVKDKRAYILTFTSETSRQADYAGIFDLMAASFKLGN